MTAGSLATLYSESAPNRGSEPALSLAQVISIDIEISDLKLTNAHPTTGLRKFKLRRNTQYTGTATRVYHCIQLIISFIFPEKKVPTGLHFMENLANIQILVKRTKGGLFQERKHKMLALLCGLPKIPRGSQSFEGIPL